MDRKCLLFFVLFLVFITPARAANFFDVHTNYTVQPNQNVTIWGGVYNYSNTSQGFEDYVVVANLTDSPTKENGTVTTGSDGNFTISLNTTGIAGDSKASVSSNFSSKTLHYMVTNITSATIEFVENLPPFSVGGEIIAKVTCSGDNKANQTIAGDIFAADGANVTWGHNTSTTNDGGVALINFTIPSNAATGRYVLSVDNDAGFAFFMIKRYTVGVKTEDDSGAAKNTLSPGDNVTIESRIVDANGNPKNVTSVTCDFIDENNTISSVTGSIFTDGTYQCNFTTDDTAQSYDVKVTATDASGTEEVYTKFSTKAFSVRLVPRSGGMFFHEFGGRKSFTIDQPIEMDIVVVNVSSGELIAPSASTYGCNVSDIKIWDVWYAPNGTSFNSTVSSDSLNTGMYMMSSACNYRFSLGSLTGIYGIKVNLTLGSETITGQGYFTINKYLLKVEPATIFGGMDFHVLLKPEENASFKLSVYNLTDGSEMGIGNITDAYFTKIVPLSFTGAMTELSTGDVSHTFINGSDDKYFNVILPSNTGPQLLMVTATVAGENVTGEAFYMAKYLMGFASPSGNMFGGPDGDGGGEQMGPGEGGAPEGGEIKCTEGTVEFTAQTMDASTMQPVKGVTFLNIIEAREEATGKDVSHCFSSTRGISDTSGQATFNFTFSGCSGLSGPYFVMFNVSWKNMTDQIPAFFMCRQFSFWPNAQPWDAQPSSTIEINITNVTDTLNGSYIVRGGNVSIVRLMNFNPNMGGKVLEFNDSSTNWKANITLAKGEQGGYRGSLSISPTDFSLERWPNGFYDGSFQVCDNVTETCDSNFFGFSILPFRAYTTWWQGQYQVQTFTAGDVINTTVFVQTNVSCTSNCTHGGNQTQDSSPGFDIKIMSPESMTEYTISTFNFTNVTNDSDNWGKSDGWHKYNVSMTLPSNIKKGWYNGFLTINNTNAETVDIFIDFKIQNYIVGIPYKEKLQAREGIPCCDVYELNNSFAGLPAECFPAAQLESQGGWNRTQWENVMNTWKIDVSEGAQGEACLYKHFNLSAEDTNLGAPNSDNMDYSVLVFGNNTDKMFFLKNTTNTTFRYNETNRIQGTKQYVWNIEGPWYITFANATNLTVANIQGSTNTGGLVQEMWGFGGQYKANETFSVPFIVIKSSAAQGAVNVTIENIFELEIEGFGVKDYLSTNYYHTYGGNLTDSNGIAFVMMNVTKIGKFKPFWGLNTTSKDTGSFDKSPVIDVKAFNTWGNYITLLPQTSRNVTLHVTAANTTYGDYGEPIFNATYYNGTFTETLTNQFYSSDVDLDTWYFMLANASSNYNMLYIDNDLNYDGENFTSIDVSSSDIWSSNFGHQNSRVGVAEVVVNDSGSNQATVTFYTERSNQEQMTVTSPTQKLPVELCTEDFEYNGMNTTINLTWVNWYQSFMPTSKTVGLYNLTTGASMNSTSTSSLFNEGCIFVEILPNDADGNAYQWEEGQTEVKGTVTDESGNQQEIWIGQVNYWTS